MKRINQILQRLDRQVTIQGLPTHTEIPGNELVDIIAKEATGWRERGSGHPAPFPLEKMGTLVSASKPQIKKKANRKWAEQ